MFKNILGPRLSLILSMTVFGTIGLFVRNIAVTSGEIALYRSVMAVGLIGAFLVITKQRISLKTIRKEAILLLFSGVAMGFNWILLFEAYRYTTVSAATLSYYFAPVIVTVACPILFKEKLTVKQIVCFVFSTVGIVLITGIGDIGGGRHWIGILLGLGAAMLYATVVLLNKFIRNVEGIRRTFLQFFSAMVVLTPYVLLTDGISLHKLDGAGWLNLLIVGVVHSGIAYCLYFSALRHLSGQQAALLSYVDPLVAVVMSVTILGETMTDMQIVGGALILGFTLWNELTPIRGHQ